jgi:hypothetical protein
MSVHTLYLGGFGLTLMANPAMYFAGGLLPYWTTGMDEAAEIQNRLFGTQLLAIALMSHLHGGEALVKKLVFFSCALAMIPIVMGTQKATGAPMMWEAQCAAHAFVTYLAYNAHNAAGGDEAKKK